MRSLLFATWGLYERWKDVTYIPSFKPGCEPIRARCVLPLLLKCIDPEPEKVFIFVADTALKSKVDSYEEVVKDVEDYYLQFLDELDIRRDLVEFIVAPGTGRFRRNGLVTHFEGCLADYYSYAFYSISKILSENDDSDLIISLDLSHGINYMPVLTYRALKEALELRALNRNIDFAVYNSEPYIQGVRKLRVHLVEKERMVPRIVPDGLSMDKCRLLNRSDIVRERSEVERLGRRLDETLLQRDVVEELNAFLGSLINGLPLALLTLYPNSEELEKRIDDAVSIWRDEMEIVGRDGELDIRRKVALSEDFVKCVRIWFLAKILKLSRKDEVSLAELHGIRSRIYSKWSNLDSMISRDLDELENLVRQNFGDLLDNWRLLSDFLKGGGWSERNFLAHSGFERNVVKIMIRLGKIEKGIWEATKLRYISKEIQKILTASKSGLKT